MGAYLSEPKREKFSDDEVGKYISYGASSMQGWRISQEDAHNCCLDFDENVSLFAVYDGHGGHEVAAYCAEKLPDFIKNTEAYKNGDVGQALIDGFLGFDATLDKPEIIKILKKIASARDNNENDNSGSDEEVEENISNLCKEALMPLNDVIAMYQCGLKNLIKENKNKFVQKSIDESSKNDDECNDKATPGCSTSSAAATNWKSNNESDVSSSSQCESSSSSKPENEVAKDGKVEVEESVGSSQDEQVLDSTTSNGEAKAEQVSESLRKRTEMPDSSEDAEVGNCCTSSPRKISSNDVNVEDAKTPNGDCNEDKESDVISNSDNCSSSISKDNVSSSSGNNKLSSVGNGQDEQLPSTAVTRKCRSRFYHKFIYQSNEDDDDDDDGEDDEEEDDDDDYHGEKDGKALDKYESSDDDDDSEGDDDDDDADEDDDEEDDVDYTTLIQNDEEEHMPGLVSGCTAVVAVLKGNDLYVANAGDSRCVLCRDGKAVELSFDHKPEDEPELERILNAGGRVTPEGRVNGGLNLSRALGDHSYKKNTQLPPQDQMISALPDIRHETIDREHDQFLILACDGIWNFMSSQDVVDFVSTRLRQTNGDEPPKLSAICEELFEHCLAPNTHGDGTGCDNMTAVIVQFHDLKKEETKENAKTEQKEAVTAKRPLSEDEAEKVTGDNCAVENDVRECKRLKPEDTQSENV